MTNPKLKTEDPTLLEISTKEYETEELNYKREEQAHETILKSIKNDIEFFKKKY